MAPPTVRVSVRLPSAMVEDLDRLVAAGSDRTRGDALFHAIRDYIAARRA